jgi:hypothetical protein
MSWKKILSLLLLLAVLGIAIVLVDRHAAGKLAKEGTLLDMPAAAVEKIELRNKDGRFVIARRDTQWFLEEPLAAKADKVALESILDNFCPLKYDRLVAESGSDLKAFGLEAPEIELKLFTKEGSQPGATILLGLKNSIDDSSYARLAAGGKVVSIPAYKRNDLEKDLFALRDKKLLALATVDVSSLEFNAGNRVLAFTKKNDQWFMEKPLYSLAQDAKVSDILSAASTLEALSFIPAADAAARSGFGLDRPLLTADFHSAGTSRKIVVGKKGERFYAWVAGSSEIGEIGKDFSDKFSGDAAAFREKKVARFYAFDAREVSFRRGDFRFSIRKNAAGSWEFSPPLAGKKPSPEKIDRLLTALADCQASDFIDGPRVLPGFTARAEIKTEDPADPEKLGTVIMEFSDAEGETVIARTPSLPYLFKIDKQILEKLPGKIDDITEETPAPADAGK